jgi:hypothetical protein
MQIESSLSGLKQGNQPALLAAYTQLGAKALQPQTIPKKRHCFKAAIPRMSRRELADWVQLQVRRTTPVKSRRAIFSH